MTKPQTTGVVIGCGCAVMAAFAGVLLAVVIGGMILNSKRPWQPQPPRVIVKPILDDCPDGKCPPRPAPYQPPYEPAPQPKPRPRP